MKKVTYEIVIEREDDPKAGYSVYCPDLPGCFQMAARLRKPRETWPKRSLCIWNRCAQYANEFQNQPIVL